MTWHIVQFSKDQKKIRLVDHAFQDGYPVGDRFLEGCMFKVTIPNGNLHVEPDEATLAFFESKWVSAPKWSEKVKEYLERSGGDNLHTALGDPDWYDDEIHISDDLDGYIAQGYELVDP